MKIVARLKNALCCFAILVLPIGIYQGDADSVDYVIGGYGGTGQYASVIRGCDREAAAPNSFVDVAGAAAVAVPSGRDSPLVIGLRGGYFQTDWTVPRWSYGPDHDHEEVPMGVYDFGYVNPNISLELKYFGIGVGYVTGNRPENFSGSGSVEDTIRGDFEKTTKLSGHLRVGRPDKLFFSLSVNENLQLVSGGGYFDLGIGFSCGRNTLLFNGVSGGLFDEGGVVHQFRARLSRRLDLNVNFRWGSSVGVFENAVSAGLVYRFPRRGH
ncbi:MAG: hypothetical protein KAT58_01475 [candidate division Zixibacteria bacterium]|nr:hypothetical protein [candidate division Zixibacteria bacterium]